MLQICARRPASALLVGACVVLVFLAFAGKHPLPVNAVRSAVRSPYQRHGSLEHINNATLGFEKIYVIGLPTRTDRRDRVSFQAALSNIDIEWVDGVRGETVLKKVVPSPPEGVAITDAEVGCWRAHMEVIADIIRRNLTSAIIMEDDADWDVRIRDQLRDFALSTRALTQPLVGSSSASPAYADPSRLDPGREGQPPRELSFDKLPATVEPRYSPYGDDWDMLWIGHCGDAFPTPFAGSLIPTGRVVQRDDVTVAPKKNLHSVHSPNRLVEDYPAHTRVVHHSSGGVCTAGYAVSQRGARRIMQEIGLKPVTAPYDLVLQVWCQGSNGRRKGVCLSPQPLFINAHLPAGSMTGSSDIRDTGDEYRTESVTNNVRWSVRQNADAIIEGRTDFFDQYPD